VGHKRDLPAEEVVTSATLRLTVWQNLLISDIPEEKIPAVQDSLEAIAVRRLFSWSRIIAILLDIISVWN
jgi:sulfite reductase beta subunit-like hemoprotein